MSCEHELDFLAQIHARQWLSSFGQANNHDLMFDICDLIEDEEYKANIEKEIFNLSPEANIISVFNNQVESFINDVKEIENMNSKGIHNFKLVRLKPNTNNISIDI